MDLFKKENTSRPLADQLRPQTLEQVVGQDHLIGPDKPLTRMVKTKKLKSCILWGPPGCGKTTIARLIAKETQDHFELLSAVFSGVSDLKKVFTQAKDRLQMGQQTILFVDEIHRFNKAQQDTFLPYVEDGTIVLIGATTENPSFELNAALLSRCQVFVLHRHDSDSLEKMLEHVEKQTKTSLPLSLDARETLKALADGDGRYLLNMVEDIYQQSDKENLSSEELVSLVQKRSPIYDKKSEGHYNLISAVHKSLRGSDTDAALYWAARMLNSGEDPAYLLRRLTRFAVEDIGLADPQALVQAIAAWDGYDRLGSPEGNLIIAQLIIYLGTAPKSNATYTAWSKTNATADKTGSLMPPKHILNAPTSLMKDLGYGENYQYDHDTAEGFSGQNYFPEEMQRPSFYQPKELGFEREIKKRLDYWNKLRKEKKA